MTSTNQTSGRGQNAEHIHPDPGLAAAGNTAPRQPGESCQKDKEETVRLDDSAKGEVYVCFEGPLGAHLKQEVRERIWKGEYVEIFSLLPLERFNLDRSRRDDSKKEDEEKRRFRLIPRTFSNWLQAFAILANVIGEKSPKNCSPLFCYMDIIGEAYRVYGGQRWLRYDEQFCQRKAVRPNIRWDHKDISLWMRVTVPARPGQSYQPFLGGTGGSGQLGHSVATKKGLCFSFNEGSCRFGTKCKFKHECSSSGDVEVKLSTKNLKSAYQFPEVVTEKLHKEVALSRMVLLVNDGIDHQLCSVLYTSFDAAMTLVRECGQGAHLAKTDIEAAFLGARSRDGTSSGFQETGMSGRTVESSLGAVRVLLSRSLSAGTWSHYRKAWDSWVDWEKKLGEELEDEYKLVLLIGHNWESGWSVPKINNFLAGLAFGFKFRGLQDLTKAFMMRQVVRGWRKGWKVADGRCPVSYDVLLILGEHLGEVCTSQREIVLFIVAFSLAFFGAFRLGELISPSKSGKGGLLRGDVEMHGDRVTIFLHSSKTDTDGRGCKVVLFEVKGSPLCPVWCLRNFLSEVGKENDPLLVHEDGSFLSCFQFLTVFRRCLDRGGISARHYSEHSFRIGAATEAARRGLGEETVKRIGHWESARFRSYVRPSMV
ncbi:uncharacterized protein [Dendrobates tinctorius]|uniref:uncharacterized protein n=1 Tax=Dendrobates tinctorius TaxID=92724 RepID=UPI003CC9FB93